ncbi:hypothetical protein GCM10027598_57160 [Amycolatopsis oliviviridis]|uniref:DUF4190 domain-containing protein n=1 Tax=Amycolatopsis oliviviridis TaxID=1471590 RepID=A0ABQ3LW91_9PSEU|nr:hypothetical protein [Amycolatopsis oliviviridis]GHH27870.1 hypothetical protein GCM10017790_57810 [Amycolatopsis oliviviridis]
MSESKAPDHGEDAGPPRRTAKRVIGGIVLILFAGALLFGGIQALVDPDAVLARSSRTPRSADTEAEAKIGGLLLCSFGLTVLFYGVFLLRKKNPSEGSPFGKAPE